MCDSPGAGARENVDFRAIAEDTEASTVFGWGVE